MIDTDAVPALATLGRRNLVRRPGGGAIENLTMRMEYAVRGAWTGHQPDDRRDLRTRT